jgi:DNA-binding response OmpR family regulator
MVMHEHEKQMNGTLEFSNVAGNIQAYNINKRNKNHLGDEMKILFVEDEHSLQRIISKRLSEEGHCVDSCLDGETALEYIQSREYDCILLDILLPKIDGLTVLKKMRESGILTPTLLLTARDTVADRVKGLDAGADDYLVKPFSLDELSARIRALLRRNTSMPDSNVITINNLVVDTVSHQVKRNGQLIELTSKEYALLVYLLYNKNRLLTRSQIADHVWDYNYDNLTNIVDVYIRYLRTKIDVGHDVKLIHTVRGSGYILRGEQ